MRKNLSELTNEHIPKALKEKINVVIGSAEEIYEIYKENLKDSKGIEIAEFVDLFGVEGGKITIYENAAKHEEAIVLHSIFKGLDGMFSVISEAMCEYIEEVTDEK